MTKLDFTHDPKAQSWVVSANDPATDFPLQNLPHGVFSTGDDEARGGIAIGDQILDLRAAIDLGLFNDDITPLIEKAASADLKGLLAEGNAAAEKIRHAVFALLSAESSGEVVDLAEKVLIAQADATMHMPLKIGSFTDFMTSVYHVTAARRSRPARPLNENFLYLPVAYNSKASTITVDKVPFPRPLGQYKAEDETIQFGPTQKMDFEVEFGALIGCGNDLGAPIPLQDAQDHLFGYVIVNDWSARDIQLWEMRLGPFSGKSFRSTISPWIVTQAAMAPFRMVAPTRGPDEPQFFDYLDSPEHQQTGNLAVALKALIRTEKMRSSGEPPFEFVDTHLRHLAWTLPQMLVHQSVNGSNQEPGDLISTGTVSGPTDSSAACLFELTAGTLAFDLPNGESRVWLEDGDEIIMTARAEKNGFRGIGFGECSAMVAPAKGV